MGSCIIWVETSSGRRVEVMTLYGLKHIMFMQCITIRNID